jgi:hypothetical protein
VFAFLTLVAVGYFWRRVPETKGPATGGDQRPGRGQAAGARIGGTSRLGAGVRRLRTRPDIGAICLDGVQPRQ